MLSTITVPPGTPHLPWADVEAECILGLTISDAAAVTIAAAWQSPGRGAAFAQLASTGSVDVADILADLATATREAAAAHDDHAATALAYLAAWVISRAAATPTSN